MLHAQGEKHVTDPKDAAEASIATAAAAKDTEGIVAKEAAAVKAEATQPADAAPAGAEAKEEAEGGAAAAERAASEQDASTSGRETVPGQTSPQHAHSTSWPQSALQDSLSVQAMTREALNCDPD